MRSKLAIQGPATPDLVLAALGATPDGAWLDAFLAQLRTRLNEATSEEKQ
ncbi:MAG TPA: hypothetical protein VFT29_14435 [Gemmatimonadaceae bacterium]|nr:hypothetical protein [Gemmatimonadaceae bacterium]